MIVTKSYCDHCGVELDDKCDDIEITVEVGYEEFIETDLCHMCYKKLASIVMDFCNKKE